MRDSELTASSQKDIIMVEQSNEQQRRKAFLIGFYNGAAEKKISEDHLQELALLTDTFGVDVVEQTPQALRKFEAATIMSLDKIETLKALVAEKGANIVIFDHEMSPAQQRNLEKLFGMPVIDRAEVILGVFSQRAQTKEARLQIELAQTRYQAPRLKRMWTHLSRQAGTGGGGGGKYTKGEGEKQIEIDRRLMRKKIDVLQKEIEEVRGTRETQRSARERSEIPVFAIVGYTNAGKSTLLNALTHAGVFVEDKLFATLDTTTRKFTLPNNQDILLIDTVGFIRKLPHLLVAAFKSTLEEAVQADILLHLIDVSHPLAMQQAETTLEVLKELNAGDKPIITVFNKVDKPETLEQIQRLRLKYPKTVQISALNEVGFEDLQAIMIEELSKTRRTLKLRIPQSDYNIVTEVIRVGQILAQDYEDNDVLIRVSIPTAYVGKLKQYVEE
jgi:GTP-binding protein HflX